MENLAVIDHRESIMEENRLRELIDYLEDIIEELDDIKDDLNDMLYDDETAEDQTDSKLYECISSTFEIVERSYNDLNEAAEALENLCGQ